MKSSRVNEPQNTSPLTVINNIQNNENNNIWSNPILTFESLPIVSEHVLSPEGHVSSSAHQSGYIPEPTIANSTATSTLETLKNIAFSPMSLDYPLYAKLKRNDPSFQKLQIKSRYLNETKFSLFTSKLKLNTSLLEIDLSQCSLSNPDLISLIESLKDNHVLQRLHIWLSGDNTVSLLANLLTKNTALKSLVIRFQNLEKNTGIEDLLEAIKTNKSLEELHMGELAVGFGVSSLVEFIKSNSYLKFLSIFIDKSKISKDLFNIEALKDIVDSLPHNLNLKLFSFQKSIYLSHYKANSLNRIASNTLELDLSGNEMTAEHLSILEPGLRLNSSLTSLNLSGNLLDHTSAPIIRRILENTNLVKINLSYNKLMNEGLQEICNSFKKEMALRAILLTNNGIGLSGAAALSEIISLNVPLKKIDLSYNEIPPEGFQLLKHSQLRNSHMLEIKTCFTDCNTGGMRR